MIIGAILQLVLHCRNCWLDIHAKACIMSTHGYPSCLLTLKMLQQVLLEPKQVLCLFWQALRPWHEYQRMACNTTQINMLT